MSEGTVQQWCRDGRTTEQMFMMKSKAVGRPSVVRDDLVQSIDSKICERWRFTISEVSPRPYILFWRCVFNLSG
jgi:hypothetical protein